MRFIKPNGEVTGELPEANLAYYQAKGFRLYNEYLAEQAAHQALAEQAAAEQAADRES